MHLRVYSDIDQTLEKGLVYDLASIHQSIKNILMTRKGTRLFNSQFGSNIEDYLFEFMDDISQFEFLNEVVGSINKWEPRVIVDRNKTSVVSEESTHTWWITLQFTVKSFPSQTQKLELGIRK